MQKPSQGFCLNKKNALSLVWQTRKKMSHAGQIQPQRSVRGEQSTGWISASPPPTSAACLCRMHKIVLGLKATVTVCADPRGWNALLFCLVNHPSTLGSNLSSFLLSLPFSSFLPSSLPFFLYFNKIFTDAYYIEGYHEINMVSSFTGWAD